MNQFFFPFTDRVHSAAPVVTSPLPGLQSNRAWSQPPPPLPSTTGMSSSSMSSSGNDSNYSHKNSSYRRELSESSGKGFSHLKESIKSTETSLKSNSRTLNAKARRDLSLKRDPSL